MIISSNIIFNGNGSSNTTLNGGAFSLSGTMIVVQGVSNNPSASANVTFNNVTIQEAPLQGIYSNGILTINNSVIRNNKGGAIFSDNQYFSGASLFMTNVEMYGNVALADSGSTAGIYALGSSSTVSLTNVSIYNNTGQVLGAAIRADSVNMYLSNVTIANNKTISTGPDYYGGAGLLTGQFSDTTIVNSTIFGNTGPSGSQGVNITNRSNGNFIIKNSIVGSNPSFSTQNCLNQAIFTSQGNNLFNGSSCAPLFNQPSDISGSELKLAPIAYGTSSIPTRALLLDSAGVNAANNNGCPTTDARGVSRPVSIASPCDIGAYEMLQPAGSPLYRFFGLVSRAHFFARNESEAINLRNNASNIWRYEGIAYPVWENTASDRTAVYRFFSKVSGAHFYTANETEKNNLITNSSNVWNYEGIAFYSFPTQITDTSPVYRFYSYRTGAHFFTANKTEADNLKNNFSNLWRYENISYYAFLN